MDEDLFGERASKVHCAWSCLASLKPQHRRRRQLVTCRAAARLLLQSITLNHISTRHCVYLTAYQDIRQMLVAWLTS